MEFKGGKRPTKPRSGNQKTHTTGGVKKTKDQRKPKFDRKKIKAAAPTTEELDNELMKYMGEEFVAKKLDSELDAYFKSGGEQQ